MNHHVIFDGHYLFILDALFEELLSHDLSATFKETETGITLEIWDAQKKKIAYSHETPYKEKRRCIEQFVINMVAKGLEHNKL